MQHHGRTFAAATRLLPPGARRHVWALYAFARYVDDLVDEQPTTPTPQIAHQLDTVQQRLTVDLNAGSSDHPLIAIVVDTVGRHQLDPSAFDRFFCSMRLDLTVTEYATLDDLETYVDGSAAVVGEFMLPLLIGRPVEHLDPAIVGGARQLGVAFQFTNFIRDVVDDLGRGRVYVPVELLDAHGADLRSPVPGPRERAAIAEFVAITRDRYRLAADASAMLPPRARWSIAATTEMYTALLDEIEASGHDVFTIRHSLSTRQRARAILRTATR